MSQGKDQEVIDLTLDFKIHDHGSIIVIEPITEAAEEWTNISIAPDAQWWARGFVVEPRYVAPILDGIDHAGLTWEGL